MNTSVSRKTRRVAAERYSNMLRPMIEDYLREQHMKEEAIEDLMDRDEENQMNWIKNYTDTAKRRAAAEKERDKKYHMDKDGDIRRVTGTLFPIQDVEFTEVCDEQGPDG